METQIQLFGPLQHTAGLAFRSTGSGPALVLFHGGTGSRLHWLRNLEELARHFRVVTVDQPGFGESGAPAPGITNTDYIDWVADALSLYLQDTPYHLGGFSFGGALAAATAAVMARRGKAPEKLTLASPAGFGKPVGRDIPLEKIDKGPDATEAGIRGATARNLGRWMLAHTPGEHDDAVNIHLKNVTSTRYDSRQVSHGDTLLADLQATARPVQILLGEADPLIYPNVQARAALVRGALPGATVQTIPGAGHWLAYEAADAVNRALIQFHLPRTPE